MAIVVRAYLTMTVNHSSVHHVISLPFGKLNQSSESSQSDSEASSTSALMTD